MNFSRKTLLLAAVVLGTVVVSIEDASACGRRGSSFSYRRASYSSYARPAYSHPNYVVRPVQPVQTLQPVAPQGIAPQPGMPPVAQQPLAQVQQPVAPIQQQQQVTPLQTQQSLAPVQPQQQVSPVQQQQAAPAPTQPNAQMSALQALGGFAPPAAAAPAPQPQVQTPNHVGTWSANLGNGASVRLNLNADGTFVWSATNKTGTASSFSGTYTTGNGTLNLVRSNDSQQLSGSMTLNGTSGFSFKVAGNNAAAISFARA